METWLEREYRRWTGILECNATRQQRKEGRGPGPRTTVPVVDNSPVLALFREASRLTWPVPPPQWQGPPSGPAVR